MHGMNAARLDLNLLVVFDAVAATGSVTAAAHRLALSQPAVSHALNRLRDVVGDPLFVRSGNRLVPTPRAQAMVAPVREVLATAGRLFAPPAFDPAATMQAFRIAATDYSMMTVVPDLVRLLRQRAPGATLDIRPFDARALSLLESGDLDASFWAAERPGLPFLARTLFRESYLGLVCASHPLAGKARQGTLTVGDYLAHPHVMARWSDPRQSPVDARLAALGHARRVAVTTPNFAANIAALPGTDLIMTLPSRLCGTLDGRAVLAFPLPFEVPSYDYALLWHRRTDADPANAWFRDTLAEAAAASLSEGAGT